MEDKLRRNVSRVRCQCDLFTGETHKKKGECEWGKKKKIGIENGKDEA